MLHPILDEFYGEDLAHDRSSCYASSKGLVTTAPATTAIPPESAVNDGKGLGLEAPLSNHVNACAVSH